MRIFFSCRILRCGAVFVRGKIVRCGAVRLNRAEPHRTVRRNRTVESLGKNSIFSADCGSFLALSVADNAGGAGICTLQHIFGPRPGSVARALGVQSRASWPFFTRSLSAEPEPSRSMETLKCRFFIFSPLHRSAAVCEVPQHHLKAKRLSKARQPQNNSSRASSFFLCDSNER